MATKRNQPQYLSQRQQFNFDAGEDFINSLPDNSNQEKKEEPGNFARGFKKSMYQIPQTIGGAIGLAGDVLDADGMREYGMNIYDKNSKKVEELTRDSDSMSNVMEGNGSFGDWLSSGVGYVGGQALTAIGTGGIGGLVGKKIAERGVRHLLENQIEKEAAKAAVLKGAKIGAASASFGSNLVQEAGSIYPEALLEAQKNGVELTATDKARVIASSFAAAGIDTLGEALIAKKFLGGGRRATTNSAGEQVNESIARAAVREVPLGMAKEAGTEGVQTAIERYGANQGLASEEAIRDYVDSASLGALGGAGGGASSSFTKQKLPETGALSRAANAGIDAQNAQGAAQFTGMDSLISAVQNDDNPSLAREIAQRQAQEQINQPESIEGVPSNFAELLQQSNQQREQERIETRESWEGAKEQAAIELAEQDRIEQENRLRLPAPDMPMPDGTLIDDNGTLRPQTYQDAAVSQVAAAQREELGQSVPYGERGGVENVSVPSAPNVPEAPTYILHPSGKPFTNKIGAQTRLKQLGGNHTIVPYEGGYAIKSNESQPVTQGQEQQAATGVPEATAGSSQSESAVIQPGDIMHPSGKPFTVKYPAIMTQRQSGGEIIKVDGGYIVRPPKQPSLEEIVAESQSEPTYEKGKTGAETARNKLDAENPFLSFLAKYGLKIDERSDVGGERGKARLIPGHGPLFRQNGLRLDELAQMAKEAGFLSQEQINSETDNGGVNALSEMIGQALNNEVVSKVQSEPEVNPDVQMLNEATKLGLDTTGKTPDQVYDMIKAFHDQKYDAEQEQEWNTALELFNDLSQEAQELAREYNLQELNFDIKELENAEENDTGGESQVSESVTGGAVQAEEINRSDDETSTEQAQGVDAAESGSQEGLDPTPIAPETDTEAVQDLAKTEATKPNAPITDLGEKIGGARKDTANSFGPRNVEKAKVAEQDEPAWRRRYIAVERVIGSNTTSFASSGKWAIQDTKTNKIAYGTNFASKEDAENAIPLYAVSQKHRVQIESRGDEPMQFGIWRQVSDSKRVKVVKENFGSREEAMQYMADHAAQIIETKTSYREELFARPEKVMRQGKERRTGDVDGNDFIKTFGFRGVEFGNWNNQAERQELLNHAYDGLMDLAEILNIPDKAISLNGDLGLAFGARGQGLTGAAAHYERGYGVINLTKMAGAGSLAHEWFHAFDHYVGRLDGKASSEKVADKNGNLMFDAKDRSDDYASHGFRYESHSKARKELRDLYEDLIRKMFSKAEVYVEDTANAEKFVKKTRDSLADQLKKLRDNLSSQLDERYYKRKNKPASQEQLMKFDAIAESLINGENLETSYVVKESKNRNAITTGHHTNSSLQEIGDIYKDVRGRSGHLATRDGVLDVLQGHMSRYLNRIKILKEAESGSEKTKRAPTSYRMNATEIDQGSATDYWSTPHEMAARAFSAYVEDKVLEQGGKSDFLSYGSSNGFYAMYGVRPFPAGAERTEINSSFDKLFAELKTKETDKGISLFSREGGQRSKFGFDVDELQPIVDQISSTWKNAPKINVVQTVDDLPFDTPSDVRGAYYKKQVYLVAANLRNRAEAEAVLLHETLGHAGLNGLFGNDLAPALRSIAMKNRKIAEAAAVWRKNNTDIKGKRTDDQYHLISIEEALADYAGTGKTIDGVGKLLAAIQKGLRVIGLNSVADWMESATDAEVLTMLASARNHIEKGSEFSVFGERQAQVFSRQQSESEFFKGMGIETGATPIQEDQYFNEVSWKTYGTDKKTGLPTWGSDKVSLQSPRDVTQAHDVFYAPQNKERAVKYDIHDAQGKKVGYTVIELDGDMPKQLLDIEIDKDQRGNKHAENTVAALAADAGELGIWRIVDSARSWWDRIGTRTVDEYDGTINFKDYADARASREDKSGLGKTVGKSDDPALFSRTKTVGDNSRTRTPEQLQAFENVGRTIQVPTLKERFNKMTENLGKKLAQGIVDQFAPIKDLSEEAYGLMRLSKGASGAFEAMLKGGQLKLSDGVYDFDDTKRGGVIDRLLAPLQGESDDFMWWIAGNRAEALSGQGKENLFTASDIKAFKSLADGQTSFDYTIQHGIQKGKKTRDRTTIYNDSLKTFNEFNKNTLDMAEQSGLIDAESRKLWESEFYIPFYRVNEESDDGVRGMNIKSGVVRQQAFKKLKGGSDKLNSDLLENTLMNWAHLLDASAKNRAAKASLEAAAKVGAATPADSSTKKTVWYMDSGDKKYYTVEDPHLLTAIQGLEYAGMRSPIMNAMSVMKHAMTVGVTASPFFKIRNLIRDSVSAIAISGLDYNPGKNIKEGWKLTNQKSDEYFRLLAGGGTIHFGAMLEGSEAKRVRNLVESGVDEGTILRDEGAVKEFYRKHVSPMVDAYNELGNRGESINRASLYDQLIKQGKNHAEASLMARDLMDFSMQGAWTSIRFLTQVVPFMNARLQGLYKLGRSASEDPKRFGIVLGAVAAASISLMLAYADDDDWKKREDWDRDNFWWFKVGGTAFRIPKPFEIGAIGTLAERGVEYFTQDEMTGERFMDRFKHLMLDSLSMNPIPQMVKPVMDVYANKDSFTGRPIESMSMERLRSDYRFNGSTSMLARATSTAGNAATGDKFLSPVQIDHLIRGYFGWLGTFIVGASDKVARPLTDAPEKATPDYLKVLSGGIVSDVKSSSSRYVAQMYDQAKIVDEAYGTWRMLVKTGKLEEAKEFAADNADKLRRYKGLQNVKRSVSTLNEQIRVVERSNLSSDQKREKINLIQQRKDNIARRASL